MKAGKCSISGEILMGEILQEKTVMAKPKYGKGSGPGARRGNRNALRHGLHSSKLPAGCGYIEVQRNVFRRKLEDAVMATRGGVTLTDQAYIFAATKAFEHFKKCDHGEKEPGVKLETRLYCSSEAKKAAADIAKAIAALDLDKPLALPWQVIPAAEEAS
jgi:hypothetical protein